MRKIIIIGLLVVVLSPVGTIGYDTPNTNGGGEAQKIIAFLNQTIVWYRQLTSQQQAANEPSDVLFLNDNRQLADQVVRLAFDYARARAQVLGATAGGATTEGAPADPTAQRYKSLVELAAKSDQRVKQSQREIDSLRLQLQSATGTKRRTIESAIDEVESELALQEARRDAIRSMVSFVSGTNASGLGSGSLQAEVEELARTVPAAATEPKNGNGQNTGNAAPAVAAAAAERKAEEPSGILALITHLLGLRRKLRTLDDSISATDALTQASKDLRAPLLASVRELARTGDQLANQDAKDAAALAEQKKQIEAVTAQFKQASASMLPLGKQAILLDLYKRSVSNWRGSVNNEYTADLKSLILRLTVLGIILILVAGFSDLWRRATFRYIQDVRRRYQFLLLRRIVVWSLVAIIVAVAFANELGSLATFAGLLTAGIAVALQNVILSVAGYFFLIGKYGVRVGDRVQIAGVTGNVVDIGLVRLHLMEVEGGGAGAKPTGRVVVFSNAIVFQANAGLFKQIPGTSFGWHEITLTLPRDGDYRHVEQRLLAVVDAVFADYRENMEVQRRSMERTLTPLAIHEFRPESRIRLRPGGVEIVIRYPVELHNASEIDNRITRELLDAAEREPKLRLIGSGTPEVASAVRQE